MKANEMTDRDLDTLLCAARRDGPVRSDALTSRGMADAMAAQPRPRVRLQAPIGFGMFSGGWLNYLAAVFGGGGTLAGVNLAMVAGMFIGVLQPAPVAALTSALLVETQTGTV